MPCFYPLLPLPTSGTNAALGRPPEPRPGGSGRLFGRTKHGAHGGNDGEHGDGGEGAEMGAGERTADAGMQEAREAGIEPRDADRLGWRFRQIRTDAG